MNSQTCVPRFLNSLLKVLASVALVMLAWALVQQPLLQAQDGAPLPTSEIEPAGAPPATATPTAPFVASAPRQGLIVGGEPAAVGELPWQVAVYPGPYLCGVAAH